MNKLIPLLYVLTTLLCRAADTPPRDAMLPDNPQLPSNYRLHIKFSGPSGGTIRIGEQVAVQITNNDSNDLGIEQPKSGTPLLRLWTSGKLVRMAEPIPGSVPGKLLPPPRIEPAPGNTIEEQWIQPLERSDHGALVGGWNDQSLAEGKAIYTSLCIVCHGTKEQPGSLPTALRFSEGTFKNGSDPYSMYSTLTRGFGQMVPQGQYTTRQKYSVIHYIRETFLKPHNPSQYFSITQGYLDTLPKALARGEAEVEDRKAPPYERMDFGPALFWTLQIEPGNIAYKAIAIRLDEGDGGVSKGRAWMVYDHDTMRVATATTGRFVDWKGIAFDGSHQTHTSLTGDKHFVNPVGPGWRSPDNRWDDDRLRGRDGRPYGPLARNWAHYEGLYLHGNRAVLSMTIGGSKVLESPGWLDYGSTPVFFRTINVSESVRPVTLRIAPTNVSVSLSGGGQLRKDGDYWTADLPGGTKTRIAISRADQASLEALSASQPPKLDLDPLVHGGPARWPRWIDTPVIAGTDQGPFQSDLLMLPESNPWNSWMRPGGFDFLPGEDGAVVSTWNGDIWRVAGLGAGSDKLRWRRLASGLFQPLGVKLRNGEIFAACRDQIVRLKDLNGDGEFDYIENFNNDHQVTEHFHEFAMGLQTDAAGNFYYAKSARHALPALVPHHGTLLKVSADGLKTEIVANGFRAANGVCLNDDGTFFVTDQEGHWTPKNRINRVRTGGFYGNMFGYTSVTDTSDSAMEQPMVWITNDKDRSPAELLWVPRETWGPLGGTLLNLSYGTGRIFAVPHEQADGRWQGAVCELPLPAFKDGVMRGRFARDGSLYACGMFAWAGNATAPGGFHRIRPTGRPAHVPLEIKAHEKQIEIRFSDPLDSQSVTSTACQIKVWHLERSATYGSKHYDEHRLEIAGARLGADERTVVLDIPGLTPTQCYELVLKMRGKDGTALERNLHGTIHFLGLQRAETGPQQVSTLIAASSLEGLEIEEKGLAAGGPKNLSPAPPAAKKPNSSSRTLEGSERKTAAKDSAKPDPKQLTLDRIFDSDEFSAESLGTVIWSKRKSGYFTLENPSAGGGGKDVVWNDPASGSREVFVSAQSFTPSGTIRPITIESMTFSEDESKILIFTNGRKVWRRNTRGDYWVLDIAGRELKKLGGDATPSSLFFAKFSPDGRHVAYVRSNNLFVQDIQDLKITQLTTDGSASVINGTSDWVYEEELDLRDAYRWSPDSRSIAYWQLDTTGVPVFHLINNTDGLYPKLIPIPYPKVGQKNSAARVGVVRIEGGVTSWLKTPGDARNNYIAQMEWTPDGTEVILQQFNRLQNTNLVMLASPDGSGIRTILTDSDPAWLENENPVRWVNNGKDFIWISERDGWRHAYLASRDGKRFPLLTRGEFDLIDVESVDDRNGWLYITASPSNATQKYLYRTPLSGGKAERLTPGDQPGTHSYNISPDNQWAFHTWSGFDSPPIVELIRLPSHKVERTLVRNKKLRDNLAALNLPTSEFLKIDIGNKVTLDAWAIKPPALDRGRSHPILFHVYGEPHGQTVRDAWMGQNGLWHRMLAQQGYIVASVDNRGTISPRGRDFRKVVYKQVGILAPKEQAAAVEALLKKWPYADPKRVGVWGWSGGGSMTLNAMLQFPDIYRTGMAIAPVPNQRLYDSIYQERYMGSPEENADGYRRGSPITYAAQLKGNLLLVHGTGDDNCHYQGMEALMNEFIANNKPFTVMPYPNRSHSISEGRNTTRHLYNLLTSYLHQNLPVD